MACEGVLRNTLLFVPNGRRVSRGRGFLGERPRQPSGECALGFDPLRTDYTGRAAKAVGRAASFPSGAGRDRTGENVGLSPRRVKFPKPRDGCVVSSHRLLRGGGGGGILSPRGEDYGCGAGRVCILGIFLGRALYLLFPFHVLIC